MNYLFLKSRLRDIGLLITVLSITYFFKSLFALDFSEIKLASPIFSFSVSAVLAFFYAAAFAALAYAWLLILRSLSAEALQIPFPTLFKIYGKTNLMKYLPGNVMEFVGRNVIVNQYNIKHSIIALSSLLQILVTLTSAVLIVVFFNLSGLISILHRVGIDISSMKENPVFFFTLFFIFVAVAVAVFRFVMKNSGKGLSVNLLKAAILNCLVFLIWGTTLFALLTFVFEMEPSSQLLFQTLSIFILSWTTGYITIGAPGGLGVRESLTIVLLTPITGHGIAVVAALVHRAISITADILTYFISLGLDYLADSRTVSQEK